MNKAALYNELYGVASRVIDMAFSYDMKEDSWELVEALADSMYAICLAYADQVETIPAEEEE